jgi:superfamily II DNA/RNA helicase
MAARRPHKPASRTTSTTSPSNSSSAPLGAGDAFADLGVPQKLVRALVEGGITEPFPIQAATLPDSLSGRDVLGRGRTGSGKTYAFVIPVLARLATTRSPRLPNRPRALILAPTRELATQINASLAPLARALDLRTVTVFGGVPAKPQIAKLAAGVDVVVACPGRLDDHVRSGHAKLDAVEITVLDEADHMADLGFLPVVRRLLDLTPADGQRMLFSATLDSAVDVLVRRYLNDPATHSVDSAQSPVASMDHHVLHINRDARIPVLVDLASAPGRTLVFTRTKSGAAQLARKLTAAGVPAVDLHGNLSQGARTRNLKAFADGTAATMVATDIAARGIHVDDIGLVVHADPPVEHKAYLHRSGRTARAGASGTVVTLMTDAQVSAVRTLTRRAGIKPTITRAAAGHPVLTQIAPGERALIAGGFVPRDSVDARPRRRRPSRGAGTASSAGKAGKAGTANGSGRPSRSDGSARRAEAPAPAGRQRKPRHESTRRKSARGSYQQSSSAAAFSSGTRTRRSR